MSLWIKSYFVIVIYEVAFKSKETSKQWLPKREKKKTNKQTTKKQTHKQANTKPVTVKGEKTWLATNDAKRLRCIVIGYIFSRCRICDIAHTLSKRDRSITLTRLTEKP